MSNSQNRGTETMAAANRARNPGILMIVALLVLGGIAFSPVVRADRTQDRAVKEGISAFESGAFAIALKKLQPLAKANNSEAAYWLGRMYEDGLGVKKDAGTAVSWYRKSAEDGLVEGKLKLGEIYLRGTEELQNFEKAHKWLEEAANDGSARAQRELGTLYANGWGANSDPVWAYVWYEFAAKQGDFEAQRLRDSLLKTMTADQVTEAQNLTQKIAPEVFGQVRDSAKTTPDHSDKNSGDAKASTPDGAQKGS